MEKRVRISVTLPIRTVYRLRWAALGNQTMASLIESGIEHEIKKIEKKRGASVGVSPIKLCAGRPKNEN